MIIGEFCLRDIDVLRSKVIWNSKCLKLLCRIYRCGYIRFFRKIVILVGGDEVIEK